MISTLLIAAASGSAAVAIARRARRSRAAAFTDREAVPTNARGNAARVRVLMAPAGLAVALPRYVTNADGDVVACWDWDHPDSCNDTRHDRAA